MKYKYSATNKKSEVLKGEMIARTPEEVELKLQESGLIVLEIAESIETGDKKKKGLSLFQTKVPLKEKIMFFTNLAAMLKAGLPIVDALDVLKDGQKNLKMLEILDVASYDIQGGMSFHSSLSKFPDVFSMMDLSMFEVGEIGGTLEQNVKILSEQLKKQSDLKSSVKSAMMYPIVISIALVAILIIMVVYVMPQLTGFFKDAGLELPVTTRALISISDFIINNGVLVAAVIIVFVITFNYLNKTNKGFKRTIDKLILKIPFVGDLMKKLSTSQYTRTLASLLKSGVPIVKSLEITQKGFNNIIYYEAIGGIMASVESGTELATAMGEYSDIFYPMAIRMTRVGNQTGTVDESLLNISNFYDEEVMSVLGNLSSIIEPVLLLTMGIVIAIIALSVISPIYQLVGGISAES